MRKAGPGNSKGPTRECKMRGLGINRLAAERRDLVARALKREPVPLLNAGYKRCRGDGLRRNTIRDHNIRILSDP